jgi:hypothetical protein
MTDDNWVSATDVAAYAYCARSYWLQRVVDNETRNAAHARFEAGALEHRFHGHRVWLSRALVWVAVALTIAGVVAARIGR